MYTTAKAAEPWLKLFPKIKKSGTNLEISLRGVTYAIAPDKRSAQVQNTSIKQYR
ncbi:hypothetical protein [Aulosira sp. FACHB-615]|uniref:hypothetical protein n=1 Tax=Aulosira sp. FACHB-615 TaxID=2692777 RepID=UPI0016821D86|nr:hypothetical protein [Aulosira sp. FACHB-615]MBD2492491.1 hypothetical protein [Aulosira sp. FACHB-615]